MSQPSPTYRLYRSLSRWPGGRWLFSRALCVRAPYFRTIHPRIETLEPGRSVWRMPKRRGVENHIGTVHALAMGNLCELVAGTLMEVSLPTERRWIPKGMQIDYLAKATTDLVGETRHDTLDEAIGDVPVEVVVRDTAGQAVVKATITMYVTEKTKRKAA